MHKIGIICEYNPFHNGHLYQIKKIKETYKDSLIIVCLSSCFMQRGEASILNKWDKTRLAIESGVDLVLELPFAFATQYQDIFAKGALTILNHLKIDTLVFGSECNDIELLNNLASIQLKDDGYNHLVKRYLDLGLNYPTSLSKALFDISGVKLDKPNDLLALAYIKEIIKNNYDIEPFSIRRTSDYHNSNLDSDIVSASTIRKLLKDGVNVNNYLPYNIYDYLSEIDEDKYFALLKYQIINNIDCLDKFQTVDEGIENRIIKYINMVNSKEELILKVKSKRYTYNKINRMFTHILTNFTKEDAKDLEIEYLRVLGFNTRGKNYLNKIKKEIGIPIINKYIPNMYKSLDIEFRVSLIYSLILKDKGDDFLKREYRNKPVIYD
ncbi:MAG: nucleotidyltransferase [Bacilli bacterium]